MSLEPRISVLLPCHNAANTIAQAIDSILAQDYKNFELVIINDGSTDETQTLLEKYADVPGVRIFQQENRGLIATLNHGLTLCDGEYIARMDADDIAFTDRLGKQVKFMEANPDVVCCGTAVEFFGDTQGVKKLPLTHEACVDTLLLGSCFAHPTVMLRKAVLEKFGIRYDKMALHAEDYALWCELASVGRLANLDYVGLRYRIHGAQISQVKREHQMQTHVEIATRFRSSMGLKGIEPSKLSHFLFGDRKEPTALKSRVSAAGTLLTLNMPWRGYGNFWKTLKVFARRHVIAMQD